MWFKEIKYASLFQNATTLKNAAVQFEFYSSLYRIPLSPLFLFLFTALTPETRVAPRELQGTLL